ARQARRSASKNEPRELRDHATPATPRAPARGHADQGRAQQVRVNATARVPPTSAGARSSTRGFPPLGTATEMEPDEAVDFTLEPPPTTNTTCTPEAAFTSHVTRTVSPTAHTVSGATSRNERPETTSATHSSATLPSNTATRW